MGTAAEMLSRPGAIPDRQPKKEWPVRTAKEKRAIAIEREERREQQRRASNL